MAEQIFDADPAKVFDILRRICNQRPFSVERIDENVRRLRVSTGLSWFSWGEALDVIVYPNRDGALVRVDGVRKVFFNVTSDPEHHVTEIFRRLERALGV